MFSKTGTFALITLLFAVSAGGGEIEEADWWALILKANLFATPKELSDFPTGPKGQAYCL